MDPLNLSQYDHFPLPKKLNLSELDPELQRDPKFLEAYNLYTDADRIDERKRKCRMRIDEAWRKNDYCEFHIPQEFVSIDTLLERNVSVRVDQDEILNYRKLFATALCLELVLIDRTARYILESNAFWTNAKIVQSNTAFFRSVDRNDIITKLNPKFNTTEGYIFFFKIAGTFKIWGSKNLNISVVDWRIVEYGLNSEVEEVRRLAEEVMSVRDLISNYKTTIQRSAMVYTFINKLTHTFKTRPELREVFSSLGHSVQICNTLYDRRFTDVDKVKKVNTLVVEWLETCDQRLACYKQNLDEIKQCAPKKGKIEFLRKYTSHDIDDAIERVDVTIPNYVDKFNALCSFLRSSTESNVGVSEAEQSTCQQQEKKITTKVKKTSKRSRSQKLREVKKVDVRTKTTADSTQTISADVTRQTTADSAQIAFKDGFFTPSQQKSSISKKYPYSSRVLDWFRATPNQLNEKTYKDLALPLQKKQHLFHGFSNCVDEYILDYGFQSTWHNPTTNHEDCVYAAAGEIKSGGEIYRGLFVYTVGNDGEIYHRYFTVHPGENLIELAYSAFELVDFPTLAQSEELSRQKFVLEELSEVADNATVHIHRIFGSVHIIDHFHEDAELVLYPHCQL